MSSAERYRLVRTVASGGMAQFVEAVAHGMDGFERRVAIKRLLPQHARDGEHRRMFLQEARISSRLHHGGIVSIFDYGIIDGSAFLAMEFVDGLDALRALSSASDKTPMCEGIALHLVAEVAHALAYIHALRDEEDKPLGIVHRDVSPPNILLSWDGDVRLSDFGIASSVWRHELTMGGAVKGKLHYMAPEQARGERVCPAADVYALGATLDAFLGSQATGPSTSDEDTERRVQQARLRNVSPEVCELIGACLARDKKRRPTAAVVAAQAAALASQRVGGDGRGALRTWLQPLREGARRQSALDDLMGLCLVPVGPAAARTYTVTQVWHRRPPAERGTPAPSTPSPWRPAPRIPRAIFLVAAALGGLLVGGATRLAFRPTAEPSTPIAASAPAAAHQGPERASSALVPVGISREEATRPRQALVARADRPQAWIRTDRPLAWLRVGGPKFAGARVLVDGISAGFAPVELPWRVGAHNITIVAATSGRILLRKTVRLGDQHTRTAPLRILH